MRTYEQLVKPAWKGSILTRSSENIYKKSLLVSIVAQDGLEGAEQWAAGLQYIQEILGPNHPKTTIINTHVNVKRPGEIRTPSEDMNIS